MARGGGVIFKKANGGRKRKARSADDGDDDEDEEYVVGMEEEVEESEDEDVSDVNSRDLSDEASFEFSDEEDEEEEMEEEEELKGARSRKKKQQQQKRNTKKSRVSDDEAEDLNPPASRKRGRARSRKLESGDSEFELDDEDDDYDDEDFSLEEDDLDEDESAAASKNGAKRGRSKVSKTKGRKNRRKPSAPARGRRLTMADGSDDEDYDFVVKERVSVGGRRADSKRGRKMRSASQSVDSDFVVSDDDDFVEKDVFAVNKLRKDGREVKKVVRSNGWRKRRSVVYSEPSDSEFGMSDGDHDVDADFHEAEQAILEERHKKRNSTKKTTESKKGRGSKALIEDSETSDSDFAISDDEEEDDDDLEFEDHIMLEDQQKKSNKVKEGVRNRRRKRRSEGDSESSDSDFVISEDEEEDEDDFDLKDQLVVYKQQTINKKEKALNCNKRNKRKRSDLDSSDSDYLISEEDDEFLLEDRAVLDEQRKKNRKISKKRTEPVRKMRTSSLVDSDSDSFDFDDMISEEEVEDLRIGWYSDQEQPRRITAKKKEEEKVNEIKPNNDLGKQVCGICLSEEKKSIVQGLLNCCFHYFCFACIMEWSKVESRCPVCKRRFETITKSGSSEPGFKMRGAVIRVQKRDQVYQPSEEELRGILDPYEHVVCMECQQGGDDNLMLLCDICDSSAHTYCVGLGREVPEGNWYCECCRSVNEGHDQMFPVTPDEEASLLTGMRVSTNSPQPVSMLGRSSSLRIDLNSSPRDFPGEEFVSSPVSGFGASTVSGRRHIRQRIHVILSTNRQRQNVAGVGAVNLNSVSDLVPSRNAFPVLDTQNPQSSASKFEPWQRNPRHFFYSNSNLAPCICNEGSSLRHVDGAKGEVQQIVKNHLKHLSRNTTLDRSAMKKIAKSSTHVVLAACGIEHDRGMVSASVEAPDNCTHDSDDGPGHLLKRCCSSCFSFFVKDVVQKLIDTSAP